MELIKLSGEYEFYAFADQDDIWDKDKLQVAIEKIKNTKKPTIYSSNTRLVDENMNFIKNETLRPVTTLGSAIAKNYVTGCTTVFNFELMKYLRRHVPRYAPYHDWWTNLVCLSVDGISIYDYEPHMNYRQHGNNVVSGNDSIWKKWFSRLGRFISTRYHRDLMAQEILQFYGDNIANDKRKILETCGKNKNLFNLDFETGNLVDDLLFKILILLKRY